MRYSRAARITRREDLERIKKAGRALKANDLVIRVSPSPFSRMRVGVVVPRFGHTAVRRNQVKRRLRELARTMILTREGACDVVVWALPAAYRRTMTQLTTSMRRLVDAMDRCDSTPEA